MQKNLENKVITAKHYVNLGDLISALPGFQHLHRTEGTKVTIYQLLNFFANYGSFTHPTLDDKGRMVCMNKKMFDMVKPLIEAQTYIHSFEEWNGQDVDFNLNKYREETKIELHHGLLSKWPLYVYPKLTCDLSIPWIFAPINKAIKKTVKGKILIGLTSRYRTYSSINYYFLKPYQSEIYFVGTKEEHESMAEQYGLLGINRLEVENFLELAQAINYSRFCIGNQSFFWNLCEAMKHPRILEVYEPANNVHSIGADCYDVLHQSSLEYAFKTLYAKFK